MRIQLADSLEFPFPDPGPGPVWGPPAELDVPRGGIVAVHVRVEGASRGTHRLEVREGGRRVAAARWFRLVAVPVEANTGPVVFTETRKSGRNPHVIRRAPFRVFDAMEPAGDALEARERVEVLRLHVPVAPDARPGVRVLDLAVGDALPARVAVRVHAAVVRPSGPDSFPYTNWFDVPAMAARHGLKVWSAAHWTMIGRYAALMRHARQNVFWVPLHLVFARRDGVPVLDRARLVRFVDLFTRAGLHTIEGGHVAVRSGGWGATGFSVVLGGPPASSAAGDLELRRILGQLREVIDGQGWRGRWLQHVADEPQPALAADYRIVTGMVRKYLPGIPILDATEDPGLAGSVDIWCPKANAYQQHRPFFAAARAAGARVWFYTCCEPGGRWLNRLLDMELLRPALFGWGAARYGLDGFLHWGLNHWSKGQDPFRKSVVEAWAGACLPAGDTHIVYPGTGGPWSSLRLEAQREGFEDLEFLRRLGARHPAAVRRILRPVLTSFDRYTTDLAVFRRGRRALLRAVS